TVYAWSLNLTTRSSFCFVLQVFERLWHGIVISYYGEMRRHAVSIFSLFRIVKEQNFAVDLFRTTLKFSGILQ
ncbi:hypothetical protein, partial [Atlantibacter subterraneus]|uniref:hypothetical protein n=1 Tax=Atlantibacter subterraneus TaxID=255519 RepID=UPI002964899C